MSNNLLKIVESAKDPSCIACISPMFGGAWHSSIRDGDGPQSVLPPVAGDSIAQRLGLLTKYNCDTSQLDFRLASTTQNNWYVKTGLSFAGWSRPLTIIGRMYIAPDSGGSPGTDYDYNQWHPLIAQGWPLSGVASQTTVDLGYLNQINVNQLVGHLSLVNDVWIRLSANLSFDPHDKFITMTLTVDRATGEYRFYVDGILIKSASDSRLVGYQIRTDVSNGTNDLYAHLHQRIASGQNRNDFVDWCTVFDRVLNDAEIKFYST